MITGLLLHTGAVSCTKASQTPSVSLLTQPKVSFAAGSVLCLAHASQTASACMLQCCSSLPGFELELHIGQALAVRM